MYILDTNIVSDLFKGHERILTRIANRSPERPVATTVISWFEIISGRFASVRTAANGEELLVAAERLESDKHRFAQLTLLPITGLVADQFEKMLLNKKLKKIGRPDLLIACIALSFGATLVTRNTKDFIAIPALQLENWAD